MRFFIIIFLLLSRFTFASFDMNENMQKSYSHIVNLEFESAKKLLANEQSKNPTNGFIPLHQNYIDFLTIIIGEEKIYFDNAIQQKEVRMELLQSKNEDSPYYLYSQAEIHLQWAFSRLKFDQYSTAAYEFIKAYNLLEENQKIFPEFTLNKKGLGLIHALLGAVPEQFNWILNLAGLDGDVALGLSELDEVLNDKNFNMYENEVLFLLSFLQINLNENDAISQQYLNRIGDGYKENILLNFTAARLSDNLGENELTLKILEDKPSSLSAFPFYYLNYLQAMSYLYQLNYENAKQQFEVFLGDFKGLNYIKSAYHKLAWVAFLQKNYEKKNEYFAKVISEGNTSIDEDKVAMKDAEDIYFSSPVLLKARLLYDGGYYENALNQIIAFEQIDNVEYWYRLARVKSKLEYKNN
ncbi:hypothetical protein N8838_02975, partial [Flavobacteriales bacterium]|nr:hypothetical protein [Flavobacteriales bacterium]